MTSSETTGVAVFTEAMTGLPVPIQTSFFKAVSDLLGGLTAIPAAKLRQYVQGIEDTTLARSAAAALFAKAAAEGSVADPLLLQAAAEIYLPSTLRKAANRLKVAQKALEHAQDDAADPDEAAPPDDDWMNVFMRIADDLSSEQMQDLFGRILAGQIVRPGSFSLSTLRIASELDQDLAGDFKEVWAKGVFEAVDNSSEFQRGDGYVRWKRLADAGLMTSTATVQYLPDFQPILNGNGLWTPVSVGGTRLLVHFPQHCGAQWGHIQFTRVGQQLGRILPNPDYAANMRKIGQRLAEYGVSRVELHTSGKPVEVLFAQTDLR